MSEPASANLVQVGYFYWRCDTVMEAPCRSDNPPVYAEAEWLPHFEEAIWKRENE